MFGATSQMRDPSSHARAVVCRLGADEAMVRGSR
jgi:hypothetical protein